MPKPGNKQLDKIDLVHTLLWFLCIRDKGNTPNTVISGNISENVFTDCCWKQSLGNFNTQY